ncbi:MAG: hypothetical protein JSV30_00170 [Candidatus Omnitrophota bacterium]|nr:MAG: hypothetical protein JSV30_00170 [Candidatus Omnitrophota bacterium]
MESKEKKKPPEAGKRINQFIIECMFSKYFEEQKDKRVVIEREKVTA